MTYPRAAALAEVLWSHPQDRNYDRFLPAWPSTSNASRPWK